MPALTVSHARPPSTQAPLDKDLRGHLERNADVVTRITKPVSIRDIGALSAQSNGPIVFENIKEYPDFRLCDILVKHRSLQARALGVPVGDYLRTLAFRLRQPPRGFVHVNTGPVKERRFVGSDVDLTILPVPIHSSHETEPYITAMNIVRDPKTGFYNSSHAGTTPHGRNMIQLSFQTPHTQIIVQKYKEMGKKEMPIALCIGVHPAYEIMANYSGLHMDQWGELEMVGTIMDRDVEMVPCETIDLDVPAHAEIVIEAVVDLTVTHEFGGSVSPTMYYLPKEQKLTSARVTAITMRGDRPIYRNHQTTPETDHQVLPRLCHEAVLYNRLEEIGLKVKDVRFPAWGGALSVILQVEAPRDGFINDALLLTMGAPWGHTKMVVAVSPDVDLDDPGSVYHSIATRVDPSKDVIIVDRTRGWQFDPSAQPLPDRSPGRLVGKMGIDATIKDRYNKADFERTWPLNWGKVFLKDFL